MPSTSDLIAYAKIVHANVRDGGIQVNLGTAAAPLMVDVDTDADGKADVLGCVQAIGLASLLGQVAPSFDWENEDDTALTLSADQMRSLALAVYAFVQNTWQSRRGVIAEIKAGTIETFVDVGNPSLWPATSVLATAATTS